MSAEKPGEGWSGPRAPFADQQPPPADGDRGEVAWAEVLVRLRWVALGYGVAAGLALGLLAAPRRGFVLTGGAVVSIVALRSLEGVVRRLRAPGPEAPAQGSTPGGLGLAYPFRLLLLVVLVIILAVVGRDPLALVLGLSAVPLAVLVEAGLQLLAGPAEEVAAGGAESRQRDDGSES